MSRELHLEDKGHVCDNNVVSAEAKGGNKERPLGEVVQVSRDKVRCILKETGDFIIYTGTDPSQTMHKKRERSDDSYIPRSTPKGNIGG